MRLEFIGAAHVVTGSCYLLHAGDRKYLVDCGMYQGTRRLREMNYEPFPFNPAEIEAVFLTHAHIDHCGRIPQLVREGFCGKIYATKATCELAHIMLPDSAHIQESDAEIMNRKNARRSEAPIMPLYTQADAFAALERFEPVLYGDALDIGSLHIVYHDAGHILGSAILEMTVTENEQQTKIVFSGDLGQPHQPILRDPETIAGADFLLVESTYGDRVHRDYDKETALLEVVRDTMDRGGNVIIPSFAVGRTQTLLYYFYQLWKEGRLDGDIPIIIDSPLAIQATRVFLNNYENFDEETIAFFGKNGTIPSFPQVRIAESAADSRALNSAEGSAIILSASGMADAGRILHHLKHNLWRPESTVLFVGYQAEGSLGRRLVDGIKRVRVLGEEIAVKAQIQVLDGFSAHADAAQIVDWMRSITAPRPAKVFLVHGEGQAQEALRQRINEELGLEVYAPFLGDAVTIAGRNSVLIPSQNAAVSVEAEMEDVMRGFDAEYRQLRKAIIRTVVRQPKLMEPIIRTMQKARGYFKKLAAPYQI